MTYREMWDTYVEANLPPESDPEQDQAEGAANAIAAATLAINMGLPGIDMAKVHEALKRSR